MAAAKPPCSWGHVNYLEFIVMNKSQLSLIAAALAVLTSGPAQASTVTLSNITATWYDGNPSANVTYFNNPTATPGTPAQARWGVAQGAGQSGYDFTLAAQPLVFSVPPSPSPNQVLGTFTHLNNPISAGTSITDIKLKITADVLVNGSLTVPKTFNYDFDHWETPNGDNPCADGGTNGVGINLSGCADRVIANWSAVSDSFTVGTDIYTLNVIGFSLTPDGSNPFSSFWTAERADNVAYLLANVALTSDVQVPEPGSIALVGLALTGLAAVRRAKPAKPCQRCDG